MRIKRIEIIGFKSFHDKTVLHINEPITAVVGPNGCGKSNIIDAIRWCMGEQSAKHLRGKAMEDVIFAGSDTRGPAGMAEVSLTFENVGLSMRALAASQPLLANATDDRQPGAYGAPPPGASVEGRPEDGPPATGADGEAIAGDAIAGDASAGDASAGDASAGDASAGDAIAGDASAGDAIAGDDDELDDLLADDSPPPIDFSQYGEVTVTRRLFRDGTSEYFLNKAPCRLRDITEFFLGTGVGTKAYAIIEQGRVGMIVSAKPEDRRLIIEEAAGITKFKKKKVAAERKMEQTRQNLLRVSDILTEIDKQLGSLRRQAQKAERYKKYRAEVRDIELWSASHRWLGLVVEAQLAGGQLADVAAKRDAAQHEHGVKEAALVAERAECGLEERRLADLTQVVYDLENRVKLGESQVEFKTREAQSLDGRVTAATGEIEGLRRQLEDTELETARIREAAGRLDEETAVRARELADLDAEQRRVREELTVAQGDLDSARAEIGKAQAEIARHENNVRSLERRRSDLELRAGRIAEEETRVGARHAELLAEAAAQDEKLAGLRQLTLDLGQRKEVLEDRQDELEGLLGQHEARVETLRTELHRRRSRLQSLREIQERYEGFARGTRAVMQHRPGDDAEGRRIRGLVADIVQASPEYEPVVESVLGERLGSILVESPAVGLEAIQFLKRRAEGRSSFIPVSAFDAAGGPGGGIEVVEAEGVRGPILSFVTCADEYRPIAEYLLGDVLVVESLARALELWDAGVRRTLVTLDGDLVDGHGVVTGGSREQKGAGVLQQKREIRELEEICAALDRDLARATTEHVTCKAELAEVVTMLEGLRRDAHQGEITILGHEKDLARARAEAERLNERRAQLARERAELDGALAETAREEEGSAVALAAARARADDAERRQLGLIEGVTMARGAVDDAAARVTECKVRAGQVGAERAAVRTQLARLEDQARELRKRIDRLQDTIEDGAVGVARLRDEASRTADELVGLREERRACAEELASGRSEYEGRMAALQVAEVELRTLRGQADRLAAEANRLELRVQTLAADRRHLEESVAEKYRLELAREVHDHHLRPPVAEVEESRLRELKELIERMGEINLTAIEEYEELAKRNEFLVTQKQDLEGALGQLERAIAKINRTSRKRFRETFDAVNATFQKVFPRLFRGGRAELRLVGNEGEDDLLDAGVEIFAQPPGKKNVTVELLSGGEKALTAVALIFSVFLIKPSPFCILDEVDAPLDEANVGRYNELVREMTDRSQFIVITHNKRTMEIADSLYGITMQEPGCSQLVNVNLRSLGAERRAA